MGDNKAVKKPMEKLTPWELFHRLWTKAVGTEDYVKVEWQRLERTIPGPVTYKDDGLAHE